jgi:exonuclease VII small subunit
MEIARKMEDLTNQLHEVEQQEPKQLQEQAIAQHLLSEAASKLSTTVETGDKQTTEVAKIMLDSGIDKLNEAMKQLVNIRACKEKLQGKLMEAQDTVTEMTTRHSYTDEKPAGPSARDLNTSISGMCRRIV